LYCIREYPSFHDASWQGFQAIQALATLARALSFLIFIVSLLKARKGWAFWVGIGAVVTGGLTFIPGANAWISIKTWLALATPVWFPYYASVFLLLYLPARQRNPDARLLIGPVAVSCFADVLGGVVTWAYTAGIVGLTVLKHYQELLTWPFPISVQNIADFLLQISVLGILVLRFARTRRDEERMTAELEAARTVQQVLIPEEIPAIPGLALECTYKPAGQVGGDFFQILPAPNNGALIVIGDVSGKGMPAAMAVSLLVGTVRTLAHYTQSPGRILTAMNQRMLGRSKDGFTTCLVLRLDQDGAATVANAGHLAPYIGNTEVPVESDLPLGLAAQAEYTESSFQFNAGEQLTLVTDGVAEARAKTGELFGFERTASIATLSAAHIAATAAAFGQQDDITVLKIRRLPVPEQAVANHVPSAADLLTRRLI
jgi:hypothetical protein